MAAAGNRAWCMRPVNRRMCTSVHAAHRRLGEKTLRAADRLCPAACTLVNIRLLTGRMHQARLHAAAIGQPIAGDRLYGDAGFNRMTRQAGLRRLFLHAERLRFAHPVSGAALETRAPLPAALEAVLENL